ncbi:MAG: hypothetical protein ACLTDV_02650 [Eubacterium sp.]
MRPDPVSSDPIPRNDVYCERVYSPWPDLHKIMKEQQIPLFALETQDPN